MTKECVRFLQETGLFRDLPREVIVAFAEAMKPVLLAGGSTLMTRGEQDRGLFIVVSGRLRIQVDQPGGTGEWVKELRRGDHVGEMALLTGEERAATVTAVRDSELLRLDHPSFVAVIDRYPEVHRQISRVVISELRSSLTSAPTSAPLVNVAWVPAEGSEKLAISAKQMADALGEICSTHHMTRAHFDAALGSGAADVSSGDPRDPALVRWLNRLERENRFVLYECDPRPSAWTDRCLRQADLILVAARADHPASTDWVASCVKRAHHVFRQGDTFDLVLVQPAGTRFPKETRRWLESGFVRRHHHVREDEYVDYQRLARRLTDNAVGIVLGGGGARGIAHGGCIKALEDAHIPIDIVGGTSMGAIFAAGWAQGWDADAMMVRVRKLFKRRRALLDPTFPYIALLAGRRLGNVLDQLFGHINIEDLWYEFFCVSTNLSRARAEIHIRGSLRDAIRASCALPGVFPPFHSGEQLFVDGGVMDNMPIDTMRDYVGGGTIIGIDVSDEADSEIGLEFDPAISGWKALAARLNPFRRGREKTLTIFDVLLRSTVVMSRTKKLQLLHNQECDLYLTPPVQKFTVMDFAAHERLFEIGYEHTREILKTWSPKPVVCELPK